MLLAAAVALSLLSGCTYTGTESFYSLPKISDTYEKLQSAVDEMLDAGAEYSSPTSGEHRQAVQLEDLDGDGVKEAVGFFFSREDVLPLKLCIYRNTDGAYTEDMRMELEGTGFDRVSYADMDADGTKEILVGRQISAELKMLTVYDVREGQATRLLSTGYTDFLVSDLTEDGSADAAVVRMSGDTADGEMELYALGSDGEVVSTKASLSTGTEQLRRLRTTLLTDGRTGVLTECVYGGTGLVSDVFGCREGKLVNLTMDARTGQSDTAREYSVFAADINGDKVIEIPHPQAMASQGDSTVYYRLSWYAVNLWGRQTLCATTYHNYSDGWYLELEENWAQRVSVRRRDSVSGERAIVFALTDETGVVQYDYLAVYALTGDNREELAGQGGRFLLTGEGSTVYAAELLHTGGGLGGTYTQEDIRGMFHIIHSDWETGEQ